MEELSVCRNSLYGGTLCRMGLNAGLNVSAIYLEHFEPIICLWGIPINNAKISVINIFEYFSYISAHNIYQ